MGVVLPNVDYESSVRTPIPAHIAPITKTLAQVSIN